MRTATTTTDGVYHQLPASSKSEAVNKYADCLFRDAETPSVSSLLQKGVPNGGCAHGKAEEGRWVISQYLRTLPRASRTEATCRWFQKGVPSCL